jgi:tight adherence protein C
MSLMMNPYLVSLVVAFFVFVGYIAMDVMFSRKQQVEKLRNVSLGGDGYEGVDDGVSMQTAPSHSASFFVQLIAAMGLPVDKFLEKYRRECMYAGIENPNAPAYCLIAKVVLAVLCISFGFSTVMSLKDASGLQMFKQGLIALLLVIGGLRGVDLFLSNQIAKRQKVLIRAMPDTLDLMVVCVESGLALDAALARVCKELVRAHPEITKELNKTRVELALLNDRTQALTNLADRTNIVAFRSLVASLIQTEKFGTSLSDTLRVLSEDYRLTRLMLAEEKAGKLPVYMTIPLICLMMPSFVLIILGPAYVRLKQNGGLFGRDAPVQP